MNAEDEKKAIETESAVQTECEDITDTGESSLNADEAKDDSLSDLAKMAIGKELKSKFTTQSNGNVTNQYIFNIDNMSGNISSVQKEGSASATKADVRQYKLNERQDCADFVSEYKVSLHFAYAIAIAMFEYVPISDLQRLSESLLHRFDKFPKEYDENGNEITTNINPFISQDTIQNIIGAQTCKVSFTTRYEKVTERCLTFDDKREAIMENIWELFPMIRSEITSWLIETYFAFSYRNEFSTSCFVKALYNIVKIDFGDSMNRLFQQLVSREENKYLMIRLMLLLVEDASTRENACEILKRWAASPKWLWEVSLVVYALGDEEMSLSKEIEKILTLKILDNSNDGWSIYFIGGQMIESPRLRSLISRIINKLETVSNHNKNNHRIAAVYLMAISNAYQFIDKENVTLPLVAVDNKKQIEDIESLLHKIFADFGLRHYLFDILEAYLGEINSYSVSERLLNQLKSYFYVIARKSERFNVDSQRFLLRLKSKQNETAKEILGFLQEKLPMNKGLMKL